MYIDCVGYTFNDAAKFGSYFFIMLMMTVIMMMMMMVVVVLLVATFFFYSSMDRLCVCRQILTFYHFEILANIIHIYSSSCVFFPIVMALCVYINRWMENALRIIEFQQTLMMMMREREKHYQCKIEESNNFCMCVCVGLH